jgi:hypothetical protein
MADGHGGGGSGFWRSAFGGILAFGIVLALIITIVLLLTNGSFLNTKFDWHFETHIGAAPPITTPAGGVLDQITETNAGTGMTINTTRACQTIYQTKNAIAVVKDPNHTDGLICVLAPISLSMDKGCDLQKHGSSAYRDASAPYGWRCRGTTKLPDMAHACHRGSDLVHTNSSDPTDAWKCTSGVRALGKEQFTRYCAMIYNGMQIFVAPLRSNDPRSWTCGNDIRTAPRLTPSPVGGVVMLGSGEIDGCRAPRSRCARRDYGQTRGRYRT